MSHSFARLSVALLAVCCAGCQNVLELDRYRVEASGVTPPAAEEVCSPQSQLCTNMLARDCTLVVGPMLDPRALRIGSLLSNDAKADDSYQRSAILAVEQLNAAGGVTLAGESQARPLALLACDASEPQRAAQQLIEELGVHALLGPLSSQASLEIARTLSIPAGVLSVSPTATATSIGDLSDADLSWTMLPADTQRAAL